MSGEVGSNLDLIVVPLAMIAFAAIVSALVTGGAGAVSAVVILVLLGLLALVATPWWRRR